MITKKTVLVLGAGASMPFRFPSGQTLLNLIRFFLYPNRNLDQSWVPPELKGPLAQAFKTLRSDFKPELVHNFGELLYKTGEESIDAFLEYQTGDSLDIGKAAIAAVILVFEREKALYDDHIMNQLISTFNPDIQINGNFNNWYQLLWTALSAPFEEFKNNQLRIVTFNYDRSLEHYLYTCLKSKYPNKKANEYSELLCPIVHIHGSLRPLIWQSPFMFGDTLPLYTPYNLMCMSNDELKNLNLEYSRKYMLQTAIRNITVIHESGDETPELVKAHEWIQDSRL